MGGESGNDNAIILHGKPELHPPSRSVCPDGRVYEGGLELIKRAVDGGVYGGIDGSGDVEPLSGFKFFFNHVEISHLELSGINAGIEGGEEGGGMGGWLCVELEDGDEDIVLDNGYERGDAYSLVRNRIRGQVMGLEGGGE